MSKVNLLRSRLLFLSAAIVLLGIIGVVAWHYKNKPHVTTNLTPTIHQLPTQMSVNNPGKSQETASNSTNQGAVTDNNGQGSCAISSSSQWTESRSGNIIVKRPLTGSTVKNGAILCGSANLSQVQFRLIDNQIGVIAQGSLEVVNGAFSGSLNFTAKSSSGRLDVYSTDPSGKELNEVQLNIGF